MTGLGSRFVNAGYTIPKPLIEVDGKPIIEHVVNMFPGITDILFICKKYHVEELYIDKLLLKTFPTSTVITVPDHKKGPVFAVSEAFRYIHTDKEIIISYCDFGTVWDFDKFLEETRNSNSDGAIPCYIGFHPHMLGTDNYAFCKEKDKVLIQIKEKEPFTDNKMNEYASNGAYYFKNGSIVKTYFKQLIESDINLNGEYYVSLVYNLLVRNGLKVTIFEIEKMLQWGTPYDLEVYKGWSSYFYNIKNNPMDVIKHDDNTTLILPMAGKGKRFSEDGYTIPKPLLDIYGKPMIVQAVKCLPQCTNNVFICLKDHIDSYKIDEVLKSKFPNVKVIPIHQTTDGQACTCELGINQSNLNLENPIFISACDNGVYYDVQKYQNLLNDKSIDIIVWSFRNNPTSKINPNMYAWLDVDENDNIKHVSCKKFLGGDPLKTHAIIGTFFFRKAKHFIDGLNQNYKKNIRTNNEFYVDDVINQCIKSGLTIKVFEVDNYICWGTPNDYKTYNYWKEHFNEI